MKSYVIAMTLAVLAILAPVSIEASDDELATSVAISPESKVVVALHPYFSKNERKVFYLKGELEKMVPVGLMIQNYGKDTISIERIDIFSGQGDLIHIPKYTPFGDGGCLGCSAGKKYFEDGEKLNKLLHNTYMPSTERPQLSVNETFYKPWLESGKSFYGLIYIDKRNNKYKPEKIESLDDLTLRFSFVDRDLSRRFVAMLSLDNSEGNSIVQDDKFGSNSSPSFRCESSECSKMSGKELYNISKAFGECYSRSVGKSGRIGGTYWGKGAEGWVRFNKYGDYLSHELTKSSGDKDIDSVVHARANGMQHCEIPYSGKMKEDDATKKAFYSIEISAGDLFSKEKYTSRSDPEFLKYQSSVRIALLKNLIQPPKCKDQKMLVRFKIDKSGNITETWFQQKSDVQECNEAALKAIYAASPVPLPPDRLEKEAYEEGFLIEFSCR